MDSTPDKTHLMDAEEISALIDKIAQEICDKNKYANQDDFVFIGIHRGGVPLAERLVKSIEKKACFLPPLGTLDISMYRDDIGMRKTLPYIFETRIPFDINGKTFSRAVVPSARLWTRSPITDVPPSCASRLCLTADCVNFQSTPTMSAGSWMCRRRNGSRSTGMNTAEKRIMYIRCGTGRRAFHEQSVDKKRSAESL